MTAHALLLDPAGRDTTHAGLGLIISIGHWQGHPVPSDVRSGGSTGRRWCAPGEPPQPLAAWDANALTAILGNSTYAEIGWQPRPATGIARPSR
jgi:hypothetical protein